VTVARDERSAMDAGRRSKGPGCVSDLIVDRYLLDELPSGERQTVAAHLATCRTCADVCASFEADRKLFAGEAVAALAADALARPVQPPRRGLDLWLRQLAFPALAVTAAAAGLALVWRPASETRTKGGFSLSSYVLHPDRGSTGSLHQGEPLHPGDRLQFRYNGVKGGYLAVVSVDATGSVSVFYPPGTTAAPVLAGHEVALQSAVELDDTLGRELVLGLRCDGPVALADVVNAVRQAAAAARASGAAPTEIAPLGLPCDETRHMIAKTQRPGR
jgi:anti-sigma factor RsiW